MQWSNRQPFGRPGVLDRLTFLDHLRLRRAALKYASHGWAVTPGACLTGGRFACGRPGCPIMGCHPATESYQDTASTDTARVARWWRHRPHAVLLVTGGMFDVIEVPAMLGVRVLGAARLRAGALGPDHDARGPVAVTPDGRWMFLVRPGVELRPEVEHRLDVVRHGRGSWIPAAPSRTPEGQVRWAVSPDEVHWRLPGSPAVQALLIDALGPAARPLTVRHAVPRQLCTARRGG